MDSRLLLVALAGITSVVVAGSAESVKAETFSINGRAMDTGYHVNRINGGGPRMVLWDHNVNSDNQNFDVIPGNRGGQLLRHRSTGMCLNAYRAGAGSHVNTFTCNASDPDQNFVITDHGNWYRVIKLANTNFCVDSTPWTNNGQQVIMWHCLPNGQNHFQRWLSSGQRGGSTSRADKANQFFNWANGKWAIQRLDREAARRATGFYLDGECATLVLRYFQDVFLNGDSSYRAYGHGKDMAANLAARESNFFSGYTKNGLPSRGAVISFPGADYRYGHVAIVLNSRYNGNTRQVEILESNANGQAPQTGVTVRWVNIDGWNPYGGVNGWTNPKW